MSTRLDSAGNPYNKCVLSHPSTKAGSFQVTEALLVPSTCGDQPWQIIYATERMAALLGLLLISPILLLVGAVIFALSGQSPLIAHRRVGIYGRTLWVFKFRTMWTDNRSAAGNFNLIEYICDSPLPVDKSPDDKRVSSKFGRFCRKYSLDELPQLWNVAIGEMSLVGARPITQAELERHYGIYADLILQVKPGITGLWQINGRNALSYDRRREFDMYWTKHRSAKLYLTVLSQTVPSVLSGINAW